MWKLGVKQERYPEKTSMLQVEVTGSVPCTTAIGPFILISFGLSVLAVKFMHLLSSRKLCSVCATI